MRSLRSKLVLIMVLLIIAIVLVVGAFLINGVSSFYMNQFYSQMSGVFTQDYIRELDQLAPEGPERLKETLMSSSGLNIDINTRNVYILDENGRLLAGSDEAESITATENVLTAVSGQVGQKKSIVSEYMDVAVPVSGDESSYIVYIVDNRATADELSAEILTIILPALGVGLLFSILLSLILANIVIRPISDLTDGAQRVASGDFTQHIEVHSGDEIGVLTENFNHMAGVLQRTLDEIENEKNKLSTLFLHMTDGVIAFSRDGHLIHSNPAAASMLSAELAEGTPYGGIFGTIAPLDLVLDLPSAEFFTEDITAGERSLEVCIAPFSREGEQGGVLAVIHDVTEQVRTEEVRREFVSNVSHELRTPLTNIKSYTETLIDSGDSLDPETRNRFLSVILNETDRTTRIVKYLLTLSRFDYGRMEMSRSEFSLDKCLRGLYEAVLLDARSHRHDLVLDLPEGLPVITGDKMRIEQVVLNILSNSIKYTPDGGRIVLGARHLYDMVSISVEDNGIGIPTEDLPRIFERFYRVDKARSRQSGGTGLGLSIAREIVNLHGGDIRVESTYGSGTKITVTLPVEGLRDE